MANEYRQDPEFKALQEKVVAAMREMVAKEGLTHQQISDRLGSRRSNVSAFLSLANRPEVTTLFRIAKACGYEVKISFEKKGLADG